MPRKRKIPESDGLHRSHSAELEWRDDLDLLDLGEGVQVKVLYSDPKAELVDLLVKFPPGYIEPRHVHDSTHSVAVLEGTQIAEGEPMRPGDYVYGAANTPHGPFGYPEGCIVFVSFRGRSVRHVAQPIDQRR